MSQPPILQNAPPSWFVPISLGALFTVLALMTPIVLAAVVPELALILPCCCLMEIAPIGVLPAFIALRRDPLLTPGQGFAVSFIACGIGSIVMAITWFLQQRGSDQDELRAGFRRGIEETMRESGKELPPEEVDALVEAMVSAMQFLPPIVACVVTVLAALCGLATISILRRRPPAQPYPDAGGYPPQPQQHPPPQV